LALLTTTGVKAGTRDVWAEDVADIIADISPEETVLLNMLSSMPVGALKKEWVVKRLNVLKANYTASSTGVKQRSEGNPDHASADVSRPARTVIDSHVQNFSQDIEVSDRLQAVNSFGVNDEFSLQTADAVKEVAKEMEAWMVIDTFTVTSNALGIGTATDPTRMKGFIEQTSEARLAAELNFNPNWFDANAMATVLDTATSGKISAGNEWDGVGLALNQTLDEPMVTKAQEIMHGTRDSGGTKPDVMMTPPANYAQAATLGAITAGTIYGALHITIEAALKRIIRVVRIYDGQFGPLAVVNNRWLQQSTGGDGVAGTRRADPFTVSGGNEIGQTWLFERKFLATGFLIPFTFERLARTGTSEKGVVSGDGTAVLRHPLALGVIFGVAN